MRMPTVAFAVVRGMVPLSASCALLLACLVSVPLYGQSARGTQSSSADSTGTGAAQPAAQPPRLGAAGGGAIQNWSTVMMLISQTVDPDEWRDFGGTGTSTMIPYTNGVWLDAQGHLKRLERKGGMLPNWTAGSHQQWRAGSGLRTISLKELDAALRAVSDRGLQPLAQMQQLAGITHIQYVAIDKQNHDVLISGPAAKVAGNRNGFLLEDLRTLASLLNDHSAPLGCSLDPDNQGILAAQGFLADPAVIGRLGRTPQTVADQLKKKVGPHVINIFGIDPATNTAVALVTADEHMKRVGLGLATTVPKIKTYFDYLERKGSVPAQSLIRWWFAYNDAPINVNETSDLFELPPQTVAVMSEQQWVNAQGVRQATGNVDEAADAFAADMTAHLNELRETQPAYARLEGIFELGLALQLAIEASDQPSLSEWFPTLCHHSSASQAGAQTPKSVEGVTAWDRMPNGTVVAVISGGVKLAPSAEASHKLHAHINRPTQIDQAHLDHAHMHMGISGEWWWD